MKPGGALDGEALLRGNSTYLPDRVLPMLPPRLSDDLCSLRPDVVRLTKVCEMKFDKKGKMLHARFADAFIRSKARLTYQEAFTMLKGHDKGEVPSMVREAWKLASILRRNRYAKGALDLDFPEVRAVMDKDGRVTEIITEEYDESHQLIEECMLAANEAVALTLTAQKKNKTGGWRYSPESTDADSTVTGCQIVSLFAARNAGIPVPDEAFERGLKYMASCRDKKGAYGYTGPAGPRVTLTAIGSLTLSLARLKTDPSFKDSLAYLKKNLNYRDSSYPFYFEYYMSQALFHADQEVWKEWNYKNMRYLGASQAPNGSWLSDHSAAYSTSAALLSLALNYRFLPIYEQ